MKIFLLKFKLTKNNLFLTLKTKDGKELIWVSGGSLGFDGPARSTDYAAEQVGKRMGYLIKKKKIKNIIFVLTQRIDKRIRSAIKNLFKFRIKFRQIVILPKIAHNGIKLPKRKRR